MATESAETKTENGDTSQQHSLQSLPMTSSQTAPMASSSQNAPIASSQGVLMASSQSTPMASWQSTQMTSSQTAPVPSSQSIPMPSSQTADQQPVSAESYRFPWGKHKGKLLAEIPLDYISWVQNKSDAYKSNSTMQQAIEQFLGTAATPAAQSSQPASSMSSQPSRTPLAPLSTNGTAIEGPYVLTFGKHQGQKLDDVPAEYIVWLRKSEMIKSNEALAKAVKEWDKIPRVYKLGFGKYKGCTLDDVPPTYINYLHESDAAKQYDDLRKALAEHKRANAISQASSQQSSSTSSGKKKPFDLPSEYTTDYRRYYYGGDRKGGQM